MTEEHSSRERRTLVYWSKRQISKECIKLDPNELDMAIVAHLWSSFGQIHLALQLRVQLWLRKKGIVPKISVCYCVTQLPVFAVHLLLSLLDLPPFLLSKYPVSKAGKSPILFTQTKSSLLSGTKAAESFMCCHCLILSVLLAIGLLGDNEPRRKAADCWNAAQWN